VSGLGAVAILAVLVLAAIGSVQAAGTEPHQTLFSGDGGNAGMLPAANGAQAAAKKEAQSEPAKKTAGLIKKETLALCYKSIILY
jgi:hypothetical protein